MKKKFFPIFWEDKVEWVNVNKLRTIEICNRSGIWLYNNDGKIIKNIPKDNFAYEVTLSHLIEMGILPTSNLIA